MRRFNYRHIICILITLGFAAISIFVFPDALGRVIEALRDFGLSVAYYFCELFGIEYSFTPTVTNLPQTPFFPSYGGANSPTTSLPETWSGFKNNWGLYWEQWIAKDNFFAYLAFVGNLLFSLAKILFIVILVILILILVLHQILKKQNNDYDKDSKPLKIFKRITYYTYRPVKIWLTGFFTFLREHKLYLVLWACLWLYNFNAFTIVIEFFAYYFYFSFSFDISSIYMQVYKLFLDLWTVLNFIPLWAWFIIGYFILNAISTKRAYDHLYHNERRNRGFINERGVCNTIYGYVGAGKTSLITDMALSAEAQMLDDAFEIILETDMHFPYFPWINLENWLKMLIEKRVIYDRWSCVRLIRSQARKWLRQPCRKRIFNYDYERYGLTYDDKLKITDIWQALEDYACAYFIYTIQSSYIISNYSIRSDKLISDIGNFPLWNTDFFKRDSRLIDSFSRYSHILDFDMLRLGKKMLEDNPNRNAFGFGIYVISEIDKERKNTPELQETKRNSSDCNQKNDLFNACLKMSRHACLIANRVFLYIFTDLQRTGSLNSDMLELGDTIEVYDKNEMSPVLPFFSPFWILEPLFLFIINRFNKFYKPYRYNRSDNFLTLYLVKGFVSKLSNYLERTYKLFGCQTVKLHIAGGLNNSKVKDCKWFRQSKKIYSKRFSSACLSGIFEARGALNTIGLDDLQEYVDIMATNDELLAQNSHFQNEVNNFIGGIR